MPAWLVWLIIGGAFAAGEAVSGTFVLLMMAGGGVGAAITAAAGGPLLVQVIVFAAVTALLLWLVRPIAVRHLNSSPPAITGSERLIGLEAVVLNPVTRDDGGRVRLNGAEWSARALDPTQLIAAGTRVIVVDIEGATAIVADPSVRSLGGELS
jgi:membrane protein implicated in regulation of membrane protease activity